MLRNPIWHVQMFRTWTVYFAHLENFLMSSCLKGIVNIHLCACLKSRFDLFMKPINIKITTTKLWYISWWASLRAPSDSCHIPRVSTCFNICWLRCGRRTPVQSRQYNSALPGTGPRSDSSQRSLFGLYPLRIGLFRSGSEWSP